jgi:hypothetical protein
VAADRGGGLGAGLGVSLRSAWKVHHLGPRFVVMELGAFAPLEIAARPLGRAAGTGRRGVRDRLGSRRI